MHLPSLIEVKLIAEKMLFTDGQLEYQGESDTASIYVYFVLGSESNLLCFHKIIQMFNHILYDFTTFAPLNLNIQQSQVSLTL